MNFLKTFSFLFLGLLFLSNVLCILFLDIYDEIVWDGFIGQAMIAFVLAITLAFIIKWRRDIKQSGKWFVWIGGQFKVLQVLGALFLLAALGFFVLGGYIANKCPNESAMAQLEPMGWNQFLYGVLHGGWRVFFDIGFYKDIYACQF